MKNLLLLLLIIPSVSFAQVVPTPTPRPTPTEEEKLAIQYNTSVQDIRLQRIIQKVQEVRAHEQDEFNGSAQSRSGMRITYTPAQLIQLRSDKDAKVAELKAMCEEFDQ